MSDSSLRSRLSKRSDGRNYAESLYWAIRWEGLRSQWFSRFGRSAQAEEALARLAHFEQEYADEVKTS
mgnify:CR=1 FL=1